jgi:hypothetical protein
VSPCWGPALVRSRWGRERTRGRSQQGGRGEEPRLWKQEELGGSPLGVRALMPGEQGEEPRRWKREEQGESPQGAQASKQEEREEEPRM